MAMMARAKFSFPGSTTTTAGISTTSTTTAPIRECGECGVPVVPGDDWSCPACGEPCRYGCRYLSCEKCGEEKLHVFEGFRGFCVCDCGATPEQREKLEKARARDANRGLGDMDRYSEAALTCWEEKGRSCDFASAVFTRCRNCPNILVAKK